MCNNFPRQNKRKSGFRVRSADSGGGRAGNRLHHFEALELGMTEIQRRIGAGGVVCQAERLRTRPRLERGAAAPDRVRGIEV